MKAFGVVKIFPLESKGSKRADLSSHTSFKSDSSLQDTLPTGTDEVVAGAGAEVSNMVSCLKRLSHPS